MTRADSGHGVGLAFVRQYYDDPVAHDFWPFRIAADTGYAVVVFAERKDRGAHSLACELAHGPKPSPNHQAAHSCRNRHCYYAGHLRWATPTENSLDRERDGTVLRGSEAYQSKLTEAQVIEMRLLWLTGERTQRELVEEYGVHLMTVSDACRGKTWKHVWTNFHALDEVA